MFQATILGLIQGLTEFLPISSSGHLVLAQHLFQFQHIDPAFDVFVQGGTVLSLLVYFAPRLSKLNLTREYILQLFIATIPAVIVGLLLEEYIDTLFGSLQGMGIGFLLTTFFILMTRYAKAISQPLTYKKAFLIGLAQAAAILPSLSRSGSTIGTALALGIAPSVAFDFSFLMSIPVVAGASLLSLRHINWTNELTLPYLVGFVMAAISGYFTLMILAKVMKQGKFYVFAPYTLFLALLSFYLAR